MIDYYYDAELGNWAEAPGRPCNQGQNNPTYFRLKFLNRTGHDLDSCRFQASWDPEIIDCSASPVEFLDTSDEMVILNTDDYAYDSATCKLAVPLQVQALSGELHWMWAEFMIGGTAYERKVYFVKYD